FTTTHSILAEAVNTACYVQNRVLVTKPHNKTPYELLLGRTPIGFMRPFGYPMTILNTLDPLDKFDGKVDKGFLVGYYVSSSGPTWLFDIDTLTKSMNYQPVTADNQSNPSAALEDITYSNDEEDVGAEADFTNLETNITVSHIPTSRVHKDHPVTQIIGDLSLATQTRSMTRVVEDQGGLTQINNKDFHTLARIEAIRLFLAYASFMGFMVYQIDVKSAFLYETIEEEVYVCQPLGFEDLDYPNKVYKVVKALYGLHQAPRAWYETLTNYLLENGFQRGKIDQTLFIKKQKDGKSASTPIDTKKPLLKDPDGIIVAQQADDVADEGVDGVDVDVVPDAAKPSIPSPTSTTQPPPPP
nr:putative ribonuclease H-like domain-containing protein [Tanacetum cinerariifolium]